MKTIQTALLFIFLFIPVRLIADNAVQTTWNGGSGVQGPVHYFSSRFWQSTNIRWNYLGMIHLEDLYTRILVDDNCTHAHQVVAFDIDLDDDDDLVAVPAGGNEIAWWENSDSSDTMIKHYVTDDYLYPSDVYPVDIDQDNDIDIVGCSWGSVPVVWWDNLDGAGTEWDQHVIDSSILEPSSIAAVDIDGDGDIDVVVSCGDGRVRWWENIDGQGGSWNRYLVINEWNNSTSSIDAAYIDDDADPDLLWVNYNDGEVIWLENPDSTGILWKSHLIFNVSHPRFIQAADMDNDNDPDAVVATTLRTYWCENLGSGTSWISHELSTGFHCGTSVFAEDMDLDGDLDILTSLYEGIIRIYINPGTTHAAWDYCDLDMEFGGAYSVSAGDFNIDGYPDVAGASYGLDEIAWWDYHNMLHSDSGELISSILYLGNDPGWDRFDWNVDTPPGTDFMSFVRSSDNPDSMGAWSDTLRTPCSLAGILEEGDSYFQYKVLMSTTSIHTTPMLYDVEVTWNPTGIEEGNSNDTYVLYGARSNPSCESVEIEFAVPVECYVDVMVYDLSGRIIRTTGTEFPAGLNSILLDNLGPGVYFVQMQSGEFTDSNRFVVIR